MLTAGLRCAPDTLPMNRMIAITISAGRDDRRRAADRVRERLAHHPAAGRDQHEEERAEQLGEQAPPLLAGVVEVGEHRLERLESVFEKAQRHPMRGLRPGYRLIHVGSFPSCEMSSAGPGQSPRWAAMGPSLSAWTRAS